MRCANAVYLYAVYQAMAMNRPIRENAAMNTIPGGQDSLAPEIIRKHRIYLVEDHPITRKGLTRLINQQTDLEVCGESATAAQAIDQIGRLMPDLVIVDISLKGNVSGLDLIKTLATQSTGILMLAFSTHSETLYAKRAMVAGARGYLMKSEPVECVIQGIRTILNGQICLSPAVMERLLRNPSPRHPGAAGNESKRLSAPEQQANAFQPDALAASSAIMR